MEEKTMLPELKITSEVGTLSWNFEELNAALDKSLEKYQGLIVSEDQIGDAMSIRANLRKLRKAINDRKIQEKKEFCEPYTVFETQVKEALLKIDKTADALDVQIKGFEERAKEQKRQEIADWWKENGDKNIEFSKVFEESFLNKTCTAKQWQTALTQKVEKFRSDLVIILSFDDPKKKDFLITDLTRTLDLTASIEAWDKHVEDERRVAELKAAQEAAEKERQERMAKLAEERKAQEIARQAEADRRRAEEAARQDEARQEAQNAASEPVKPGPRDYLYTRTFRVTDATYDSMAALFSYMKGLGLTYETLEKSMRRK